MGFVQKTAFLMMCLMALSACERRIKGSGTNVAGIIVDSTVPADQASLIASDMSLLAGLNLSGASSSDLSTVSISDFSGSSMIQWLRARVSYIVGEAYDYNQTYEIMRGDVNYPNSSPSNNNPYGGYYPYAFTAERPTTNADGDAVTIMSNIGGSIYKVGKSESQLIALSLAGRLVPVISPRTGVIKIGEGLFNNWKVRGTTPNTLANGLLRLAVYFHEARHSDGRGTTVTFGHAMCSPGNWKGSYKSNGQSSSLNGEYACEQYKNGSYVVDGIMMRLLKNSCQGCSNTERTTFDTLIADTLSRANYSTQWADPTPESL